MANALVDYFSRAARFASRMNCSMQEFDLPIGRGWTDDPIGIQFGTKINHLKLLYKCLTDFKEETDELDERHRKLTKIVVLPAG